MAATNIYNTAQVTFTYEDDTTRNITFNNVSDNALGSFKGRIYDFNDVLASTDESMAAKKAAYKETFISDDGAPLEKISAAKYTTTEERVIYRG